MTVAQNKRKNGREPVFFVAQNPEICRIHVEIVMIL